MSDNTADWRRGVPEGWKQELERRIIFAENEGSDYLHKYVPSVTPYAFTAATGEEFSKYRLDKEHEADGYATFVGRSSSSSGGLS